MIKPGEYKTKGGYKAIVKEVSDHGSAIGWVKNGTDWSPRAWFNDGSAYGKFSRQDKYDLDLPRTIMIPETELPEPEYFFSPMITRYLTWSGNSFFRLSIKTQFKTHEAAEQWAEFFKRVMGGKKQ